MTAKHETNYEPQPKTIELIKSGKWLYYPDLTDPNTPDPNELVLHETGQPSGLIDTRDLFNRLSVETLSNFAPNEITDAYSRLQSKLLNSNEDPASIFLSKGNYQDYLLFSIFMCTGKVMSQNDAINQIKSAKALNLEPEDKLVTIPAAIIGFSVTEKAGGKDGTNSTGDFQLFIKKLVSGDFNGTFSPLCAQYGSQTQADGTIFAYQLLDHVATGHVSRTMRWQNMLTYISALKYGQTNQLWSTISGDADHIHSIVPKVIRQYAQENQLVKMLLLLDRHLAELQYVSAENELGMELSDLSQIEIQTETTLRNFFGQEWSKLSRNDLDSLVYHLEKNESELNPEDTIKLQLSRIALNDAYPGIARFAGQHKETAKAFEAKASYLEDDLTNLSSQELNEWANRRQFQNIEDIQEFLSGIRQKLIDQGEIGPAADAIHEVVLYFTMGAFASRENLMVIGLDIDHDRWMSLSWQLGYNTARGLPQKTPVPILYARNPDTGKTESKHVGKSFAQVYYDQRQFNEHGFQPLSQMPLREYFSL